MIGRGVLLKIECPASRFKRDDKPFDVRGLIEVLVFLTFEI